MGSEVKGQCATDGLEIPVDRKVNAQTYLRICVNYIRN